MNTKATVALACCALLGVEAQAAETDSWKDTRWLLSVEEVLPVASLLAAERNFEFILKAAQVRAVVNCGEARTQKKSAVVHCKFEDVAIQAIPHGESPSDSELENSQKVLEDVVGRLKMSTLEVQHHVNGKVMRVDLIDVPTRNERERRSLETLRQLATDLVMGWTIKAPQEWKGTWPELNSPLIRAPGQTSTSGANQITHSAATVDGRTVVQSIGSGTFSVRYTPWEFESGRKVAGSRTQDQSVEGVNATNPEGGSASSGTIGGRAVAGGAAPVGTTPEDRDLDASVRSVAVVNPKTGLITERVWSVVGGATPSSVGALSGNSLWYNGNLRKLEADEKVDLGPIRMVSPPGIEIPGLPPWQPMGT